MAGRSTLHLAILHAADGMDRPRLLYGDLSGRPAEHLGGTVRCGFVGVISSLAALQVFSEPFILFGPNGGVLGSGTTVVLYLWREAFRLFHAGYGSAIAMGLLVITLGFSILQIRIIERGTGAS
jgi:hypothetical protein